MIANSVSDSIDTATPKSKTSSFFSRMVFVALKTAFPGCSQQPHFPSWGFRTILGSYRKVDVDVCTKAVEAVNASRMYRYLESFELKR